MIPTDIAPRRLTERLVFPSSVLARPSPEGVEDNLLKASVAGEDIVLTIAYPLPAPPEQGDAPDTIQLMVNGSLVGDRKPIVHDDISNVTELTLYERDRPSQVDTEKLMVGLCYRVFYDSGAGTSEDGPDQTFVVDLVAPGGSSIAAMEFPDVKDGMVSSISLREDPENGQRYLLAIVKGYAGQESGDLLVGWIDEETSLAPVEISKAQIGEDVSLRFPESLLRTVDGGIHRFSHSAEDRAGNRSVFSTSIPLHVRLDTTFPMPEVLERDGDTLDGGLSMATVIVPASAPLKENDQVTAYFDGTSLGSRAATPGQAITFSVDASLIAKAREKTIDVTYSIETSS